MDVAPLVLRHNAPPPQNVDWSKVSEVHAFGPLSGEHLAVAQAALTNKVKQVSVCAKDDAARKAIDPGHE